MVEEMGREKYRQILKTGQHHIPFQVRVVKNTVCSMVKHRKLDYAHSSTGLNIETNKCQFW